MKTSKDNFICPSCGRAYGETRYTIFESNCDGANPIVEDVCRECVVAYFYPEIHSALKEEQYRCEDYRLNVVEVLTKIAEVDPSTANKRRMTNVGIELYKDVMGVFDDLARYPRENGR